MNQQGNKMKKYHLNLLYTREDDINVINKFMKIIKETEGISIDSFSIENLTDEEFKNSRIIY